jgi:hypothetical protein
MSTRDSLRLTPSPQREEDLSEEMDELPISERIAQLKRRRDELEVLEAKLEVQRLEHEV